MLSLSEKIKELESIKAEFESALQRAKDLQEASIKEGILNASIQNKSELKEELNEKLLNALKKELENLENVRYERLKKELESLTSTAFEKKLANKDFNKMLENKTALSVEEKIDEFLSLYETKRLRFQNATNCALICLQNELTSLALAYKEVAQIEFYQKKMLTSEPIFKAFKVV